MREAVYRRLPEARARSGAWEAPRGRREASASTGALGPMECWEASVPTEAPEPSGSRGSLAVRRPQRGSPARRRVSRQRPRHRQDREKLASFACGDELYSLRFKPHKLKQLGLLLEHRCQGLVSKFVRRCLRTARELSLRHLELSRRHSRSSRRHLNMSRRHLDMSPSTCRHVFSMH